MHYFVKRVSQTGVSLPSSVAYERPSAAMKYACLAVSGLTNIWIEDEQGRCIADRAKIEHFRRAHMSRLSNYG
jgi:hypothetical protein